MIVPKVSDPKQLRLLRRKNHIAKDLRSTPKYSMRVIPSQSKEDEDARRFRRYHTLEEYDDENLDG